MKFDTNVTLERKAAMSYFMGLVNRRKLVEVKKVSPNRSLKQNAYLHLILGYLGMQIGEDVEVVKDIYKMVNKGIYYREHTVFEVRFKTPISSRDLTVEEMTASIENFRKWSAEKGYPLPSAAEKGWLLEIEKEIERSKYNLRSTQ